MSYSWMEGGGGAGGWLWPTDLPPKKTCQVVEKRNSASRGFLASCSRVETACGVVSTGEGRKKNVCACVSLSGNFLAAPAEGGWGPRWLFIFLAGSHSEISAHE